MANTMIYDRRSVILSAELQPQEELLQQLFDKDASITIFDIGACEGENSVRYGRQFPNATIYCFEPIPDNLRLTRKHIDEFQVTNVRPFDICLSDRDGKAEFHVSSGHPEDKAVDWDFGNKSSSLLEPGTKLRAHSWLKFENTLEVRTMRLDAFMEAHRVSLVDFVHMDVQGAELLVLRGAGSGLSQILNIWLEVEAVPLYQGQPLKSDVEQFFASQGYVKLIDTVGKVDGDQFWSRKDWLVGKMGKAWTRDRVRQVRQKDRRPQPSLFQRLRNTVRLRSRLRKIFKA
jgi:FkbM family methyltransferase